MPLCLGLMPKSLQMEARARALDRVQGQDRGATGAPVVGLSGMKMESTKLGRWWRSEGVSHQGRGPPTRKFSSALLTDAVATPTSLALVNTHISVAFKVCKQLPPLVLHLPNLSWDITRKATLGDRVLSCPSWRPVKPLPRSGIPFQSV